VTVTVRDKFGQRIISWTVTVTSIAKKNNFIIVSAVINEHFVGGQTSIDDRTYKFWEFGMSKLRRIALLVVVLLSCVGCDRATKIIARQELATAPMQEYWNGFFRLVYAENPGAFLSLGANLHPELRYWVFTVFVALLLGGLTWFALRYIQRTPVPFVIAVALIAGGGLGNLIDRLLYNGHVVDFMQIGYSPLRTGVFNVADMAIMAGTGLMFIYAWRDGREDKA